MNYKICITAENQAIVKRIANENGMNKYNYLFKNIGQSYIIINNEFDNIFVQNATELTTEQFVEMFDKKETELDKWLKETKAKNLSLEELTDLVLNIYTFNARVYRELKGIGVKEKAQILFNQWNNTSEETPKVETEWQPKRGDRILVWDDSESDAKELIFLVEIKGCKLPIRVVVPNNERRFLNNEEFSSEGYKFMKPLPIEQPKETDFKTKVIELIESEINDLKGYEKRQIEINEYYNNHSSVASKIRMYGDLINKIKQL